MYFKLKKAEMEVIKQLINDKIPLTTSYILYYLNNVITIIYNNNNIIITLKQVKT